MASCCRWTVFPRRSFFTGGWDLGRRQPRDRRRRSAPAALSEKDTGPEHWETAQYPPISDISPEGLLLTEQRERRRWITALPTVEEKMYHLMDDKLWTGFKLRGMSRRYNTLPLLQHVTRTHVVDGLPPDSAELTRVVDEQYAKVKGALIEAVEVALMNVNHRPPGDPPPSDEQFHRLKASHIVRNVTRTLMTALGPDYPHLQTARVEEFPRWESYWHSGGFKLKPKEEKKVPPLDSKDHLFLFEHQPLFAVCTEEPLPAFVSSEDDLCRRSQIPEIPFEPEHYGLETVEKYPTLIPGCWPHKLSGFGHVSFHSLEDQLAKRRKELGIVDEAACITEYGLVASFGWLMGIAALQGFTPMSELTYPFTTQTVITDGQNWNFFTYQMNTCVMGGDIGANPLRNVCWVSAPAKLYEAVEGGTIKGVNDDAFKLMMKTFVRAPAVQPGLELRPYLTEAEQKEEYWDMLGHWLWRQCAQKRRRNEFELYQWEKFYLHNDAYTAVNPRRQRRKQMPINIPDDPKIRLEFPKLWGRGRRLF